MRVVTLEEMREIEAQSYKLGLNEALIIENVGVSGANFFESMFLDSGEYDELVFLIGKGNNGADALSIARNLANRGHSTRAFLLFDEADRDKELARQLELASGFGVKINQIVDVEQITEYFVQVSNLLVVDGILGTGFRPPLSNFLFDVVSAVNRLSETCVAIDIPSGVSGDDGHIQGTAIEADFTLCIGLPKIGLYVDSGPMHGGEIFTIDGGFPVSSLGGGSVALLTHENVRGLLKERNKFAHKNRFGHSLVVGGSEGLTGALIMCAEANIRSGTGLVTAATWRENYPEAASRIMPEIMMTEIPVESDELEARKAEIERFDSIVIGPGLGLKRFTREAVVEVLSRFNGPVVVDADAIRVLSLQNDQSLIAARSGATVFTPHIGEFAAFYGVSMAEVLESPLTLLRDATARTKSCIVLKGPCTYIAFPSGEIFINYYPNDGMASGGSGDVLAGIIGGLLAQSGFDGDGKGVFSDLTRSYEAVCLGVVLHTLSGKHAAEKEGPRGMTARSITQHLGEAFSELSSL